MKTPDLEAVLEMQRALQEKYQDRWTKLSSPSPLAGRFCGGLARSAKRRIS